MSLLGLNELVNPVFKHTSGGVNKFDLDVTPSEGAEDIGSGMTMQQIAGLSMGITVISVFLNSMSGRIPSTLPQL